MAAHSFAVLAPRLEGAHVDSMVITKLALVGLPVKKGDVLVEFDPQAQMKDYLDKKANPISNDGVNGKRLLPESPSPAYIFCYVLYPEPVAARPVSFSQPVPRYACFFKIT